MTPKEARELDEYLREQWRANKDGHPPAPPVGPGENLGEWDEPKSTTPPRPRGRPRKDTTPPLARPTWELGGDKPRWEATPGDVLPPKPPTGRGEAEEVGDVGEFDDWEDDDEPLADDDEPTPQPLRRAKQERATEPRVMRPGGGPREESITLVEPVPGKPDKYGGIVPGSLFNQQELLENSLSTDIEQDNNVKSVSKELFNRENIELKTDISHDEINNITRLDFLEAKFGIKNVQVLKRSFLRLRVSKDRKSRQEFISALQTETKNAQGGSWFSKLFGGGNGGQSP